MREPPKRYEDTIFDRTQVDQLQALLGFEHEEKAVLFALLITFSYYDYLHKLEMRHRIHDTKNAKRQLESIAEKAKDIANLLEEHPISQELVRRRAESFEQWQAEVQDEDGCIDMARLQEEDRKKLEALIEALRVVSDSAWLFHDNDDDFRRAVHLPRRKDAEKTAVRAHLWPGLFLIWEQAGKSVATGEGPLHRFVTLVHQACELGNASASTLRDAVTEWNRHRAEMKADWTRRFGDLDATDDLT